MGRGGEGAGEGRGRGGEMERCQGLHVGLDWNPSLCSVFGWLPSCRRGCVTGPGPVACAPTSPPAPAAPQPDSPTPLPHPPQAGGPAGDTGRGHGLHQGSPGGAPARCQCGVCCHKRRHACSRSPLPCAPSALRRQPVAGRRCMRPQTAQHLPACAPCLPSPCRPSGRRSWSTWWPPSGWRTGWRASWRAWSASWTMRVRGGGGRAGRGRRVCALLLQGSGAGRSTG